VLLPRPGVALHSNDNVVLARTKLCEGEPLPCTEGGTSKLCSAKGVGYYSPRNRERKGSPPIGKKNFPTRAGPRGGPFRCSPMPQSAVPYLGPGRALPAIQPSTKKKIVIEKKTTKKRST